MNPKKTIKYNPSIIEVKNLSWHPKSSLRAILSNVNCCINKGYLYGIIGPNGSGKTSLIRHILRFLPVTEGQIFFDQNDVGSYRRKELARTCSYVAQNFHDMFSFSVYDIVAMGMYPWRKMFGTEEEASRLTIENAFEATNTSDLRYKPFHVLSGGEAQRVMIARAIAQKASWMFFDEPVSQLDIPHQMEILNTLSEMKNRHNKTIICVLHDINLASMYCDRIILMKEGSVIDYGNKKEMLTPANLQKVYGISFQVFDHPNRDSQLFVP